VNESRAGVCVEHTPEVWRRAPQARGTACEPRREGPAASPTHDDPRGCSHGPGGRVVGLSVGRSRDRRVSGGVVPRASEERASTFFGERWSGYRISGRRASQPAACPGVTPACPGGVTVVGNRGQAHKGVRWMSGHREATKDAAACDKRRGSGKRESIRRFPNGETPSLR
jgi:hypothetical protein